ncbi:MAG: response regulator transcription factor [Dehalococcoidales bacterium]|nr:MAG: response regulator transcription factor [Dehalococcoidales bacterium]
MDTIRVLLVDDHALIREGIHALLDLHDDIEIVGEAEDGKDAITKTMELEPDVVVMDIAMTGMDGLEATQRITKKHPKVKVLILTQHDNREYILSTIRAGAAGFVPKRALGSELLSAIRAMHEGNSFLYPSAATEVIKDYLRQADDEYSEEPYDSLTDREREIFKLIAEGLTSREISSKLFISIKTVIGHRTKIMEKLDIHNRTELIKYAYRRGLLSIDA